MSQPSDQPIPASVARARQLWPDLAAFGWGFYRSMGRGVLVLEDQELQEAVLGPPGGVPGIRPSYVPLSMVPQGDDFRGTIAAYDPRREILLLVRQQGSADPLFFSIACAGSERPAPPECFEQWRRTQPAAAEADAPGTEPDAQGGGPDPGVSPPARSRT